MKSWNDQPDMVQEAQVLCDVFLEKRCATLQVRKLNSSYYVTVGTLFGSQTIECPNADSVFSLIEIASRVKANDQPKDLPSGFKLLANV